MRAATRGGKLPEAERSEAAPRGRRRPVLAALAGPSLIVVAVITVYHSYVFTDVLTSRYIDVLTYYLPNYCFLGETLRAGHIALWNPYTLAGTPFAADPLSGWMYLPAMLVFAALPCGAAMRFFIVLQPIIAGLGMYWFLRGESLSRIAATVGGLILALSIAGSLFGLTLAFAGMVAWLPVMLGSESRCFRTRTWPRRLGWCVVTALAWGQIVASFLPVGLLIGTVALVGYGVARTVVEVRSDRLPLAASVTLGAIVGASVASINLAYLLPRLAYIPRTSLSFGYDQLQQLEDRLSHIAPRIPPPGPDASAWPLKLIASPGMYLGAISIVLAFAAWGTKRHRPIVVALAVFGALGYLLTLHGFLESLGRLVGSRVGSFLVHNGGRSLFAVVFALAALAGFGMQAWLETNSVRGRSILLLPGVATLAVVPLAAGIGPTHLVLPLIAGGAGLALLIAAAKRTSFAVVIPALLAVELCVNALVGQGSPTPSDIGIRYQGILSSQPSPNVDATAFLSANPLVTALRQPGFGRYMGLDPPLVTKQGYLGYQGPETWGLLANQRAVLFHVEDVQGYTSVQLLRYWSFVRAVTSSQLNYNADLFPDPPPIALDLLQVNGLVVPTSDPPPLQLPARPVVQDDGWTLERLDHPFPKVSVIPTWRVVSSGDQALQAITAPGFDPGSSVVLERSPGFGPPARPPSQAGSATYEPLGLQSARISVTTPSPSIVLVRTPYDQNWHASVDGETAQVLAADYVVQGIPVPAGDHTIVLSYTDPSVGYGLAGTAAAICALLAAAIALGLRARKARPRS
jgi:Bacterial membrane protein YfhO